MFSWLSSIGNSFVIIAQTISSFFTGILNVFALVGQSLSFLSASWVYMPSVLLVFATAGISIVVVFHLIGR